MIALATIGILKKGILKKDDTRSSFKSLIQGTNTNKPWLNSENLQCRLQSDPLNAGHHPIYDSEMSTTASMSHNGQYWPFRTVIPSIDTQKRSAFRAVIGADA